MPENIDLTDEEYTSIVNKIVDQISTNYEIQIQGLNQYFGPVEVLTDTIEDYGEDQFLYLLKINLHHPEIMN